MTGITSPTASVIARTPILKNATIAQIATWIETVAPCLVAGATQSAEATTEVVRHLLIVGIHPSDIYTALDRSGYGWTVSDDLTREIGAEMLRRPLKPVAYKPPNPHPTMGPAPTYDPGYVRLRAERLETLYVANEHDPAYQDKLRAELETLMTVMSDDGADPMPGRGQMADRRQKLEDTRKEILLNAARNVGAHIRHLSGYELARLRLSQRPDGTWRLPSNTRLPIRRAPVRAR